MEGGEDLPITRESTIYGEGRPGEQYVFNFAAAPDYPHRSKLGRGRMLATASEAQLYVTHDELKVLEWRIRRPDLPSEELAAKMHKKAKVVNTLEGQLRKKVEDLTGHKVTTAQIVPVLIEAGTIKKVEEDRPWLSK